MYEQELNRVYKQYFGQAQIISFQKFQEEVDNYIKNAIEIDKQSAAVIIAKKYTAHIYKQIYINEVYSNINKNITLRGNIEFISQPKQYIRQGKISFYTYLLIYDITGTIRVTFWEEKTNLLKDLQSGQLIRLCAFVQKNEKYGTFLKPEKIEIIDSTINTTNEAKIFNLENIELENKINTINLRIEDYKDIEPAKDLPRYTYLISDDTSISILKTFIPLKYKKDVVYIVSNLEVFKNAEKFYLKPLLGFKIQETDLVFKINPVKYLHKKVSTLKYGLLYNLLIRLVSVNSIFTKQNIGLKECKKYFFVDQEQRKITYIDWNDTHYTILHTKNINAFTTFKFVSLYFEFGEIKIKISDFTEIL